MHETLSLEQASVYLRMSEEHLRRQTKIGNIPGAKLGKEWVFLKEDLVRYIRSQYPDRWQISYETDSNSKHEESKTCVKEKMSGTPISRRRMDSEYESLLRQ